MKFENCDCGCRKDGLLHWQILREDYDKLHPDYKNCGIVFFVKEKAEDRTGEIIRNGVVYSGIGEDDIWIEGKEGEILVSDGEGWTNPTSLKIIPSSEVDSNFSISNPNGKAIQLGPSADGLAPPDLTWKKSDGWTSTDNGSSLPYCLKVDGNSQILFDGGSQVGFRGNSYFIQDGGSHIQHLDSLQLAGQYYKVKISGGPSDWSTNLFLDHGVVAHIRDSYIDFDYRGSSSNSYPSNEKKPYRYPLNSSGTKDGPCLVMHDNSAILWEQGAFLKGAGAAEAIFDEYSQLYMKNYARVDIENASRIHISGTLNSGSGQSPLICIDPKQLVISSFLCKADGNYQDSSLPNFYSMLQLPSIGSIHLHSLSDFLDSDVIGDPVPEYRSDDKYALCVQGNTRIVIGSSSGMTNIRVGADSGSRIDFDVTTSQGSSLIVKMGGYDGAKTFYDLTSGQSSNTKVKFGIGDGAGTQIIFDPQSGSRTYWKIGAGVGAKVSYIFDPANGSTTDIKISACQQGKMQMILTDNIFVQMSAKAHTEMHDESTIVMRGPWGDNKYPEDYRGDKDKLIPGTNETKKPWNDGQDYEEGWRRPVPIKNGPLNSMYDKSGFMMRGHWDLEKDINRAEEVTITLDEEKDADIVNGSEELNIDKLAESDTFKQWQKDNNQYYEKDLVNKYQWPEGTEEGEKNEIEHQSSSTEVKIKNYIFTTCPPDWSPFLKKQEGSPLLQITDNADVRISDNISITADKTGIEIKQDNTKTNDSESKTIRFTFEQLERLLELVNKQAEMEALA